MTREDYYRVIDLKTAELFRVSCYLGSSLAGGKKDFVSAAATFGQQLGIAYQIYDDLVDFFGEEAKIGKTLGTDLDSGKLTLPLFELVDCLSAEERTFLLEEITGKRPPDMPLRLSQMRAFPIFDRVNERLESHLRSAESALQPFAEKPAVARLETLLEVLRSQVAGLRLITPP